MAQLYADFTLGNEGNAGTIGAPLKYAVGMTDSTSGKTLSAGDSMLCKCGETWRETETVPSSGSAGLPITFGAYGSGANPIIDGADIAATWTADSSWQPAINWTDDSTNSGPYNIRTAIAANTSSNSGTQVRITMKAITSDLVVVGTSIGVSTSGHAYDSAPTRITWAGGSNGTTITAGTSLVSDAVNFTFDKTIRYLVTFYVSSGSYRYIASGASGCSIYYDNTAVDYSQSIDDAGVTGPISNRSEILEVEVLGSGVANVYNSTVASTPNQVLRDGVLATKGASKAALNNHEWFATGTTLSYRDDSGTPQGASYIITAKVRNYNIDWNGKNYITVSGFTLQNANARGVYFGASANTPVLNGNTIKYAYNDGIYTLSVTAVVQNATILNNTISWNGGSGIALNKASHHWAIDSNQVFRNSQVPLTSGGNQYTGGIRLWCDDSSIINCTITHNIIYSNGKYPDNTYSSESGYVTGVGIWLDTITGASNYSTANIVAYNNVYDNCYRGIHFEHTTYQKAYYNLVHDNHQAYGFAIADYSHSAGMSSTGNLIYNNTVYNNDYRNFYVSGGNGGVANTCVGNILKNNIGCIGGNGLWAEYGGENDGPNGSGNIYLYNHFGVASGAFLHWGHSTTYNDYASWEAAYGSTTYSVQSDPLFVNAAGGDFHLKGNSPAIKAGVSVGLFVDFFGNPVPGVPDIGAAQFVPGPTGWTGQPSAQSYSPALTTGGKLEMFMMNKNIATMTTDELKILQWLLTH